MDIDNQWQQQIINNSDNNISMSSAGYPNTASAVIQHMNSNPKARIVIDNGAYTVKAMRLFGKYDINAEEDDLNKIFINNNNISDVKETRISNFTGYMRRDPFKVYVGEDEVKSFSDFVMTRSHERGYLVDPNNQITVWDKLFNRFDIQDVANAPFDIEEMILTEPLFCPTKISDITDEIMFEQYGFASLLKINPQTLSYYYLQRRYQSSCFPDGNAPHMMLIIDIGYSFTHIVPIMNGHVIQKCVKRINVGGKLLTNYLKEVISTRQVNLMDEAVLVDDIKHQSCYVSSSFNSDIQTSKRKGNYNSIWRDFVLPDYQTVLKGYVLPRGSALPSEHVQSVRINNERFTIPEILFQPNLIGMEQAGLPEAIEQSLKLCPEEIKLGLLENIFIVGGSGKFQGLSERLERELIPKFPTNAKINVRNHDPNLRIFGLESCALLGGAMISSEYYASQSRTREDYFESRRR